MGHSCNFSLCGKMEAWKFIGMNYWAQMGHPKGHVIFQPVISGAVLGSGGVILDPHVSHLSHWKALLRQGLHQLTKRVWPSGLAQSQVHNWPPVTSNKRFILPLLPPGLTGAPKKTNTSHWKMMLGKKIGYIYDRFMVYMVPWLKTTNSG